MELYHVRWKKETAFVACEKGQALKNSDRALYSNNNLKVRVLSERRWSLGHDCMITKPIQSSRSVANFTLGEE